MYDFYYRLKERYEDKIKFLNTDTDLLTIFIRTKDFYKDMKNMIDEFDISDYNKYNIYNIPQVYEEILSNSKMSYWENLRIYWTSF